ncbi:MAG: hypothetical protein ACXVB1_16145 [Pseudobdellovibrionaceae bacterium]
MVRRKEEERDGNQKNEKQRRSNYDRTKYLMQRASLEEWEVEMTEVHLKRCDYEAKVVQLIKALLEIDQALKQQEDQAKSASSKEKEAA